MKARLTNQRLADAISWDLFLLILHWLIEKEWNVFGWVFLILQWGHMAHSVNIGVLGLHNFSVGQDFIASKCNKSKADQTGEKCHKKHLYNNPFQLIWFSLENDHFKDTELLFQNSSNEANAASQCYCKQISKLFKKYSEDLVAFIHPDHANMHGVQKGSATHACLGTTLPLSFASIANHGEWSLGHVLDVYWHFSKPSDYHLGRILARMDPNIEKFSMLPPHWKTTDPMSNEHIKQGMLMMFATIYRNGV